MIRMLLLTLVSFYANPTGLTALTEKPIIYTVNQNPIAAYYGTTTSGFLARTLTDYQIYASYIKDDSTSSEAEKSSHIRNLVLDIKRINPSYVIVANTYIGAELKKLLPYIKVLIKTNEDNADIPLSKPGTHIAHMLESMGYEYEFIYILTDMSDKSKNTRRNITKHLEEAGIKRERIEEIRSNSVISLESNVRALNLRPKGVILNLVYSLPDTELGKINYLPDTKSIMVRVNRKHLDIGFTRTPYSNECIVLDYDLNGIRKFIDGDSAVQLKPLELEAFFNIDRMDKMGMKPLYLRGIEVVDEIIK